MNNSKIKLMLLLPAVSCFIFVGCGDSDKIYQTSTLHALMDGVYDGQTTIGQLKNQGDLGIGTVNALDGELVILDGQAWQVRSNGTADKWLAILLSERRHGLRSLSGLDARSSRA